MTMVASHLPKARVTGFTSFARSTLYYPRRLEPVHRPRSDESKVREQVRRVALAHPTFGVRRVWAVLRREGRSINRKRVYRLIREEHLLREAHFPRPRKPSTGRLIAEQPNQVWSTDFTDILTTDRGVCHLMTIVDACTREVLAWEFLPNFGAREALTVVEQAVMREFPKTCRAEGVVLKTDCGSHFTARIFREGVRARGLELDMSRPQTPEDNGLQESFHGHFKADYLWPRETESYLETRVTLSTSIQDYGSNRPHSSLNYRTPEEFAKKKGGIKA